MSANLLNINPNFSRKSGLYRYSFNGKESDREASDLGEGTQDYGFRIYNPSLGKFLSVDPLRYEYPELTPYQFASNTPIMAIDLDGLEAAIAIYTVENGKDISLEIQLVAYPDGAGGFTYVNDLQMAWAYAQSRGTSMSGAGNIMVLESENGQVRIRENSRAMNGVEKDLLAGQWDTKRSSYIANRVFQIPNIQAPENADYSYGNNATLESPLLPDGSMEIKLKKYFALPAKFSDNIGGGFGNMPIESMVSALNESTQNIVPDGCTVQEINVLTETNLDTLVFKEKVTSSMEMSFGKEVQVSFSTFTSPDLDKTSGYNIEVRGTCGN